MIRRKIYRSQTGQGIPEYAQVLAWSALVFVGVMFVIKAIEFGFINQLSGAMAGKMNQMARDTIHQ